MNLTNFGEQFASGVLQKMYPSAIVYAITNQDYEGEIRKPGDRVNILSFLNDILLSDYVVGQDMPSETIVDAEDQLVVEKRKSWNFALDRLETLFTYGSNVPETLTENAAKVLENEIDTYVLSKAGDSDVRNWIGINLKVDGSAGTMASIATTATGGTISINGNFTAGNFGVVENPVDGGTYMGGFEAADVGKGIRLRSTATFVTPFYKITSVTSSVSATITEWDDAAGGSDFEEGMTLRGLFGGDGRNFPKYGTGEASFLTYSGNGWEFNAAIATAVSSASIFDQVTLLAERLDESNVPSTDRKLTVPPPIKTQVIQATEMQPSGIAELYTGTVVNGKVARVAGFDLHIANGSRVSTRVGKSTGVIADAGPLTAGSLGYLLLGNHPSMITYAEKWSESRVVDAENQFSKKYQGLMLWGALVPKVRRKSGSVLFGNF